MYSGQEDLEEGEARKGLAKMLGFIRGRRETTWFPVKCANALDDNDRDLIYLN